MLKNSWMPMDGPVFDRFAEKSPMAVIMAFLIARVLSPEKLDALFETVSEQQYTQDLLFSTVFDLMNQVVCAVEPSMHSAYQSCETIDVSSTALYDKLNALEPAVSAALVRYSGDELAPIVRALGAQASTEQASTEQASASSGLDRASIKVLDGTCMEATERRLGVHRETDAAPLPGKVLAVLDLQTQLITDLIPCEDGHAQERRLLPRVLRRVEAGECWIGDRNFATRGFLGGLHERDAFFVIREHGKLPWDAAGPEEAVGRVETGTLYQQPIDVAQGASSSEAASPMRLRRLRLVLDEPTRDGETEIALVTNLPTAHASAQRVASLYRERWSIEGAFQELAEHLEAELNTLGYPKAALFGVAVGVVAYNVLSVLKAALASVHGADVVEQEVSGYYIAGEVSKTREGLMIALPPERWAPARTMPRSEAVDWLRKMARRADLDRYQKHPRQPKQPPPASKADSSSRATHVSTAKLLAQQGDTS
jgi:hypothetical protein